MTHLRRRARTLHGHSAGGRRAAVVVLRSLAAFRLRFTLRFLARLFAAGLFLLGEQLVKEPCADGATREAQLSSHPWRYAMRRAAWVWRGAWGARAWSMRLTVAELLDLGEEQLPDSLVSGEVERFAAVVRAHTHLRAMLEEAADALLRARARSDTQHLQARGEGIRKGMSGAILPHVSHRLPFGVDGIHVRADA